MESGDKILCGEAAIEFEFDASGYGYQAEITTHSVEISLERTIRVPEDDQEHWLPPTFGSFELTPTDYSSLKLPDEIKRRRGVCFPIYEHEALWLNFHLEDDRFTLPVALRIAAGKINAVSGKTWSEAIPSEQDYIVVPDQPWLDGFNSGNDVIRQFVATEMGKGQSVEAHLTGEEAWGGIQVLAIPMKPERYTKIIAEQIAERERFGRIEAMSMDMDMDMEMCCASESMSMGLGAGGKIRQTIETDPYGIDAWDFSRAQRLFISMINAGAWESVSGEKPHPSPIDAKTYNKSGGKWFHLDGKQDIGPSPSFGDLPPLAGPEEEVDLTIPAFLRRQS